MSTKRIPIVRKALEEELPELVKIDKRCFKYNNVTMLDLWEYRDKTYVLVLGKKILGYYFYAVKGNNCYLCSIDVDKPYRGKGYSNIMMEHYLKHKYPIHSLHVKKNNKVAIALYQKNGFQKRHIEEDFYDDGGDAIFMVRRG